MAWPCRTMRGVAAVLPPLLLAGCASGPSVSAAGPDLGPPPAAAPASLRLQKPESELTLPAGNEPGAPAPEPAGPPNGEFAVRIRAKVNGVAILDDELRSIVYPALMELQNYPEPQRTARQKEVLDRALSHLIEREVVLSAAFSRLESNPQGKKVLEKLKAEADKKFDKQVRLMKKKAGTRTDEEFKQLIRQQGQSLEGMRRQFQREMMANEYMSFLVLSVTDKIGLQEVREYYEQHPNEFQRQDSIRWQDVFIAAGNHGGAEGARRLAEEILAQARAGADFAKLAERYDEGTSKFRGGEGYGSKRGEIQPPEAEPHLFQMRDGQIGPPVVLETGVHLIRLVKREYAGQMPLDEKTQNSILTKLKNEAAAREWKRKLKDLMNKAVIEKDLSP